MSLVVLALYGLHFDLQKGFRMEISYEQFVKFTILSLFIVVGVR